MAWSDRSRYPVPMHSAKQLDLDHPNTGGRRRPRNRETKPRTSSRRTHAVSSSRCPPLARKPFARQAGTLLGSPYE
ncbi:hypothetical protein ACFCYB_26510 [Streptomyces sp. NPDC056309]|uniref:hypothetical protein n=1 Tax=unclassified Streptomyces TaxID=2593676 RepID=UPI0035DC8364